MPRLTNAQKRILELEDALRMSLECAGSPDPQERIAADNYGRRVLRNHIVKGWKKAPPLEHYELEEQYKIDMAPDYIGRED